MFIESMAACARLVKLRKNETLKGVAVAFTRKHRLQLNRSLEFEEAYLRPG